MPDPSSRHDSYADDVLVERLRSSDEDSAATTFEAIVTRHYDGVLAYLARATDSAAVAEDLVQELFLRVWRTRTQIVPTSTLAAYLYGAARNILLNDRRAASRSAHMLAAYLREFRARLSVTLPDDALIADEAVAKISAIADAVATLPERAREVWLLHHEQELTYPEIASVLGVSVNTVKSHMARAIGGIRGVIGASPP